MIVIPSNQTYPADVAIPFSSKLRGPLARRSSWLRYALIIGIFFVATALIEWQMGRQAFCRCGIVSFWSGDIWSNQNSQQFSDPYTFTHILHGVIFYYLTGLLLGKRATHLQRLVLVVFIEAGWEILENTNFIIDRYRQATISLDYYGDSIFNSMSDIVFMMLGFVMAWKLPWKLTLFLAIMTELLLFYFIKDNLTLNIVMLIYPIEAIKQLQMAP